MSAPDGPGRLPAYGEWNRHQPLGRCNQCRKPTWYSRSRSAVGRELLEDVHGVTP